MRSRWIAAALLLALGWPATAGALEDIRDLGTMLQTLNDVLDLDRPGLGIDYENPNTGNVGAVKALRADSKRNGLPCWQFERRYGKPGHQRKVVGRACRTGDGFWQILEEGPEQPMAGAQPVDQAAASPAPAEQPAPAPTPARNRAQVLEIQQRLANLGYRPGPADGLFGRRTRDAIAAYQQDRNLAVDGQATVALLEHLRRSTATAGTEDMPWLAPEKEDAAAPAETADEAPVSAPTEGSAQDAAPAPHAADAPAPEPAPEPAEVPALAEAPPTTPQPEAPTQPEALVASDAAGEAAAGASPANPGDGGNPAVLDLARHGADRVGQSVSVRGNYLHYTGTWAKLLAEDDATAEFVYVVLDGVEEERRSILRSVCFLCLVDVVGTVEMRELEFAGASMGAVPAIVATTVETEGTGE